MFAAGGEEYFAEPEAIDRDTQTRFAAFCAKLRATERPGKRVINEIAAMAVNVGHSMIAYELVVGALFRHIKTWTGTKQFCMWCVLDKLCKENRETFAHLARQHLMDVGSDYIPWEDPVLAPKYQALVEHWDGVFPMEIVQAVWLGRKERLWSISHPEEKVQQLKDEENTWKEEEVKHIDEQGLDDFSEPCLAYMQGVCPWGENCTMLHPEGLEGTLPPECRLGDWRCEGCGTINRHFRRRCFTCPREKPQYRKGSNHTTEARMLAARDDAVMKPFRQQFGYDPANEAEAVSYWAKKLAGVSSEQWISERSAAYRNRILNGIPAQSDVDFNWSTSNPTSSWGRQVRDMQSDRPPPMKKPTLEIRVGLPALPPMPPRDRVFYVCHRVMELGASSAEVPGYLFVMCQAIPEAARDPQFISATPEMRDALFDCIKLMYTSWCTARSPQHVAIPFLTDIQRFAVALPLSVAQRREALHMCDIALKHS